MLIKTRLVPLLVVLFEVVLAKQVSVFNKTIGQLVTSSLLTWEPYNLNDPKQLEHAVVGGEFLVEKHPAYICRSSIHSVAVTGYVKKRTDGSRVCIISQHSQIKTKGEFELLMNRGNGAKVEWTYWEKQKIVFQNIGGTVSTINGGSRSEIYYIARHKKDHSMEHHEIDHAIGWFDPSEGFGKIHATIASSEMTFDSGEILATFEPVYYELHDIKFKSMKLRENRNRTLLGQTALKNEEESPIEVNAVIGYEYDIVRNLGRHEGIANSINTTVFMQKKEVYSFFWGIQTNDKVLNTKGVGTNLQPGTALNVTLWGNYTTKEGPYDAYLYIHWSDGSKSKKRKVAVNNGLEASLEEQLEIEYSPTYWLHNNTVVPTTTQKTTTSVSTSTTHRSIFSTSMSNNAIEKITERTSLGSYNSISDEYEEENEIDTTSSSVNIQSMMALIIVNVIHFIRLAAH